MMNQPPDPSSDRDAPQPGQTAPVNRRQLWRVTAGAALAGTALGAPSAASPPSAAEPVPADFKIARGRIRQSVMAWCFKPMSAETLARQCQAMGMQAIEGVPVESYPALRTMGLEISIVSSHGFKTGFCNPDQHAACAKTLRDRIDLAADMGYRNVITFTGMRVKGLGDEQMTRHCVEGLKKVVGHAEKKSVNLCLEHLNSRDSSHPMKGHPGYFGDDVDHCAEMIKQVGSPRMKLLFDIYHVQIMNGDVIRRIRQYQDLIGHYHTAGNPGRGELDETQEINYPAVMRAILETGYDGFVAQEFIPTWEDKIAALRHAVRLCDV